MFHPSSSPQLEPECAGLIASVHRWVAEYGRPPRVVDWDPAQARIRGRADLAERFERDGSWPRFGLVRQHFGGLGGLLEAAGYPLPRRRTGRSRVEWTQREILSAIRRWHELHGEPPTTADWDPYRARLHGQEWRVARYDAADWPSAKAVRNHFGRLSDAIALAGLVPRRQGQRRRSEEPLLEADLLLHVAAIRSVGDGRAPSELLAETLRQIPAARQDGEACDLRVALVELAAAALTWAAELPSQ